MNKAHETTLEDLLKEETAMQAAARMNPNAEEGLGAFLEKRKATSIIFEPASLGFKIWDCSPTRASGAGTLGLRSIFSSAEPAKNDLTNFVLCGGRNSARLGGPWACGEYAIFSEK